MYAALLLLFFFLREAPNGRKNKRCRSIEGEGGGASYRVTKKLILEALVQRDVACTFKMLNQYYVYGEY